MRILLISPRCAERPPEVYNVGLAYIASSLKSSGHEVELLDLNTYHLAQEQIIEDIRARGRFDAIAIGTLITAFNHVNWLIDELKKLHPDTPVWVGNSVASTIPELFLRNSKADVVVIGEGEITVKELAAGRPLESIHGICYRKNGDIIKTPSREPVSDIDNLPYPAYEMFDQEIYMTSYIRPGFKRVITLGVSSRGCPYHCTYCYHSFQGMKPRFHSPKRMMDEIERAMGMFNFDGFGWADDLMISNRKRIMEFCDLYEKSGIKKKWGASARVNLIDEELLKRLKSAGCVSLGFGIESGSQKILDNIKKHVTVEQARKALELCKKFGMRAGTSFMIGNVGENRETVTETVRFIEENDCYASSIFIATPYPATELYEYGLKTGKIKDELALIKSYGEQSTTLLVNFSELSDGELMELKKDAEGRMRRSYLIRHPFSPLVNLYNEIALYVRIYGLTLTFFRGLQKIIRKATGNPAFKLNIVERLGKGKLKMFD